MVDLPAACRRGLVDYSLALFYDVEHVTRVTLLPRYALQPLRLAQVPPSSSAFHGPLLPGETTGSQRLLNTMFLDITAVVLGRPTALQSVGTVVWHMQNFLACTKHMCCTSAILVTMQYRIQAPNSSRRQTTPRLELPGFQMPG